MRLWSLHPHYLDRMGLLGGWREALMAQRSLRQEIRSYRNHPQLERFKNAPMPKAYLSAYLEGLADEGEQRGYRFNRSLIRYEDLEPQAYRLADGTPLRLLGLLPQLPVTSGQLRYELLHLKRKLALRDPARLARLADLLEPEPHLLFEMIPGEIATWERVH